MRPGTSRSSRKRKPEPELPMPFIPHTDGDVAAMLATIGVDSIDDLFDAMEDTFEEVQFSQELGTWLYKFKRGSLHAPEFQSYLQFA